MSGWHHEAAKWSTKTCPVCQSTFTPNSGAHKFCSATCKGKWKYISGVMTTESQYKSISGNWPRYLTRLRYYGGRKRDALSLDTLMATLVKQDYRCALTGVLLTCQLEQGVVCPTNASVDRIQAGGPYTPGNIQLVCRAVNMWRSNLPVAEFVDWCRAVVDYHDSHTRHVAPGTGGDGHGS